MLKRFFEGIVFGAGFAISFVAIWYVAARVATPMIIASQVDAATRHFSEHAGPDRAEPPLATTIYSDPGKPFHELGIDEQIAQSSAIALARYERAPDGQMKAIVKEFLKKDPGIEIGYNVGDEYVPGSHYPSSRADYGDGLVIFFGGSPAMMRMSVGYSGDRIRGLGDIPLQLVKDKCGKPAT